MTEQRSAVHSATLLFISCSDFEALHAKGVVGMIAERSEEGWFRKVISLHPLATNTQVIQIGCEHDLIELGFNVFPGGSRWRLLRYIYAPFYILRSVYIACQLALKERVDIVRSSDPFAAGLIGWLAARLSGAAFCVSIHADYNRPENLDIVSRLPFASILSNFILQRADAVLPISDYLAFQIKCLGVAESKIQVIHHGVDTKIFNGICRTGTRLALGLPEDARIVLYVNRLSTQKFCWDALEIASQLRTERVVTVFCGDGPERMAMEERVSVDPMLAKKIMFLGFQSRETIAALASEAEVGLVLLAGFGLIELCAAGLPVVVYNMEWQTELIGHERSGLVIAEGDTQGATDAVDWLLGNKDLANSLGREAQQIVRDSFSIEAARVRRINAYAAALSKRAARTLG